MAVRPSGPARVKDSQSPTNATNPKKASLVSRSSVESLATTTCSTPDRSRVTSRRNSGRNSDKFKGSNTNSTDSNNPPSEPTDVPAVDNHLRLREGVHSSLRVVGGNGGSEGKMRNRGRGKGKDSENASDEDENDAGVIVGKSRESGNTEGKLKRNKSPAEKRSNPRSSCVPSLVLNYVIKPILLLLLKLLLGTTDKDEIREKLRLSSKSNTKSSSSDSSPDPSSSNSDSILNLGIRSIMLHLGNWPLIWATTVLPFVAWLI